MRFRPVRAQYSGACLVMGTIIIDQIMGVGIDHRNSIIEWSIKSVDLIDHDRATE